MYKFWGKVRKYSQRGKKLGFPTANINLYKAISSGIYISKLKLNQLVHPSLTYIGQDKLAETYILDFNKNIYGKWISVSLLRKVRGNKKFDTTEELVRQMKKDEQVAREYFKLAP